MLSYVKNAYNQLVTLTKLEVDRGQPVPGLEEYYLSNQFLKKVHRMLPEELGIQFLMKLQENGESYYLMKGKQYMDRMISLLRCCYKSLEIALEDYSLQQTAPVVAAVNARLARPTRSGNGGMSVNMFNVDMCPPPCTASPVAPVLHTPKKRRRKRKRGNQAGALASVEERVKKLEDELKQVRLQLTRQEHRIAELENKMVCPEVSGKAADAVGRKALTSVDANKANSIRRTVAGKRDASPPARNGSPRAGDPNQKDQAQATQPAQPKRRRRPRRKRRRSKHVRGDRTETNTLSLAGEKLVRCGPVNSGHCGQPGGCVGGKNSEAAPVAGCTALASLGGGGPALSTGNDREPTRDIGLGFAARNRKYAVLYAQKTRLAALRKLPGWTQCPCFS
jgi:hypothetical protein